MGHPKITKDGVKASLVGQVNVVVSGLCRVGSFVVRMVVDIERALG